MKFPEFDQLVVFENDGIPVIKLDRPEKLNALNTELFSEVGEAVTWLQSNNSSRAIILTAEGKGFIAGADLGGYASSGNEEFEIFQSLGQAIYDTLRDSEQIVIAAVNGYALGGGMEMVLASDVVFASESAKFGLPEIGVALLPGGGGTAFLRSQFPIGFVKDLILSGRFMKPEEALQRGIAQYITSSDDLMHKAIEYAQKINSRSPDAVLKIKRLLDPRTSQTLSFLAEERKALLDLFAGANAREGISAFLEKRDPEFEVNTNA